MTLRHLTYILLLLAIMGCQKAKESRPTLPNKHTTVLESTGEFRFKLDPKGTYYGATQHYIDEKTGREYLIAVDKVRNAISWFGFEEQEFLYSIDFPAEGPSRMNNLQGLYVHNTDSIFLWTYDYLMYLVNGDGKTIRKYDVLGQLDRMTNPQFNHTELPLEYIDGKLYMSSFAGGDIRDGKSVFIVYDVYSGAAERKVAYPIHYTLDKEWDQYPFGVLYWCYNRPNNQLVFSFAQDHKLYVGTPELKNLQTYKAQSDFFPEDFPEAYVAGELDNLSTEEIAYRYLKRPNYRGVIYDPYRQLYYRFAFQPVSEARFNDEDPDMKFARARSVIILNGQFEKIGETSLGPREHFLTFPIVREDGLYLRKLELTEDMQEYITYEIFEPVPVAR